MASGFADLLRVGSGFGDAIYKEDENGYGRAAFIAQDIVRATGIFSLLAGGATRVTGGTATEAGACKNGGWLKYHENAGGHTLSRHVGQSDANLINRLNTSPRIAGASAYTDQATAQAVTSQAIRASRPQIKIWLRGAGAGARYRINYTGSTVIGRGIMRGQTAVSNMTNTRVILVANGRGGYYILTSFPQ